jgi:hypothetical protein
MSHIFWDHLIDLDELAKVIGDSSDSREEKEEMWGLVDEIVHHKVLGCIFDHLPKEHHEEFLERFHKKPYDETLVDFLNQKIDRNIEEIITQELGGLAKELLINLKHS